MIARALLVAIALLAGAAYVNGSVTGERVPPRAPLSSLPMQIGPWRGERAPDFTPDIVTMLGVDEYVNRLYGRTKTTGIGLYIGYYGSQRQGDAIHSPLNCLPGAGWEPVDSRHLVIPVADDPANPAASRSIEVNRVLVQKGLDKLVVVYWYQSHNRVIASEYWGKVYMVLDAIRMNRTDGALVRVISPLPGADDAAAASADRLAVDFVQSVFPLLGRHLPS